MTLLDDRRATRRTTGRRTPAAPAATHVGARGARSSAGGRGSTSRRPRGAVAAAQTQPSGLFTGLSNGPFVVALVLLVLGVLGFTLYLSTTSAQDSYSLTSVRRDHAALTDKRDDLKRTADSGDSAPELADKAAKLGMIPAVGVPHLVVGKDGKARLRGDLTPAEGRRLASLNPAPDPVSQIDASKVDDSGGLGGTPAPAPAAEGDLPAGAGQAPAAEASVGAPAPEAPEAPEAAATAPTPAPNVLPENAATPGRNAARAR